MLYGPGFIDAVEPLEQMGQMLLRDPGSIITNQQYGMVLGLINRYSNPPCGRVSMLYRIMKQVINDLFDLIGVTPAQYRYRLNRYTPALGKHPQMGLHLKQQLIQAGFL